MTTNITPHNKNALRTYADVSDLEKDIGLLDDTPPVINVS